MSGLAMRPADVLRVAILAVAFVLMLLAVAVPGAYAFEAGLEYSGKLLVEEPAGLESKSGSEHDFGKIKLQLSWTATGHTTSAPTGALWHFTSLTGTAHFDTKGSSQPPAPECSATLSERPGSESYFTIAPSGSGVQVSTELPLGSQVLQSSDTSEDACSIGAFFALLDPEGFSRYFAGEASASELEAIGSAEKPIFNAPAGGPWSAAFDDYFSREIPSGAGDPYLLEISSTLIVGSTGTVVAPTAPPSVGTTATPTAYGPKFDQAKAMAEADMRKTAIPNAERLCLPYAGGLVMAGAGVLTLGLGPAGGILAMTGTLTSSALAPFCNAAVTRLSRDYKTFKDPPLDSVDVLAEPAVIAAPGLPSCGRYRGRTKKLCAKLRAAYANLDTTAMKVAATAAAIEETVSREHAAYETHNQSAVSAQDTQLSSLLSQQSSAEAEEARAGKTVAGVLRSAHIGFKLSQKQSAKVVAHAQTMLAAAGVTVPDLRAFDPSALVPAKTNLLAALSEL